MHRQIDVSLHRRGVFIQSIKNSPFVELKGHR